MVVGYTAQFAGVTYQNLLKLRYNLTLEPILGSFQVEFPSLNEFSGIDTGQVCNILRDGQKVFTGLVEDTDKIRDEAGRVSFVARGSCNKIYLQKFVFQKAGVTDVTYGPGSQLKSTLIQNSSSINTVFSDILANQPTLTAGVNPANSRYAVVRFVRQDCLKCMDDLSRGSLYDWRVNPDNTVDFTNSLGIDRSATIQFKNLEQITYLASNKSIGRMQNKLFPVGPSQQGSPILATISNAASITANTEFDKIIPLPSMIDPNVLTVYGQGLLTDIANPITALTVEVVDWTTGAAYYLGDTIKIIDSNTGTNGNFKVLSIERTWDATEAEVTKLECGNINHTICIPHFKRIDANQMITAFLQMLDHDVNLTGFPQNTNASANQISIGVDTLTVILNSASITDPSTEPTDWWLCPEVTGDFQNITYHLHPTFNDASNVLTKDVFWFDITSNVKIDESTTFNSGDNINLTDSTNRTGHKFYAQLSLTWNNNGSHTITLDGTVTPNTTLPS